MGNWHVRSRLVALIVVPTAVAVGLGGLSVVTSLSDANTYQTLREVAELSEQLGAVTHELAFERDETALYIAQGRPKDREAQLNTTHNEVNSLIEGAKQRALALTDTHAEAVRPVLRRLEEVPTLRETAVKGKIQPLPMIEKYSQIIARLLQFHDQVGQVAVDDQVADSASAMSAISRAKEQASKQRGILASALDKKGFDSGELDALTDAKSREESEETLFGVLANLDQLELYRNTVVGRDVDQTDLFRLRAMAQASEGKELSIGVRPDRDVATWFEVSTGKIDALRTVEKELSSSVILRARALEEGANRSALISGVLILLLLIVVLAIISLIARSLIRPLRRLRREALDIAGQRLPETVRQLRESGDGSVGPVVPIGVDTHDEIGEVARAFDEVHREAVRLAGEESRLRSNVNAMFVNLSRRSQTLVERQITLIDGLEQGEQDEQRLGNLFKLDHLATRMRRNSENLLVLAGQDPPRRWSQPVKLVDVARASLSEVESYERVVLQVPDGVSVAGQAVNDVIHLLAELVENALSFSPRETRVTVSGSRIDGGGVMLSITDSGIGMTQEELVQSNERLTEAPSVDVSVSRRMGLFVVARLAHRHGIRVQLRPHSSGGLTAMVLIPENMLGSQAPAFAGMPSFSGNQPPSFSGNQPPPFSGDQPPAFAGAGAGAGAGESGGEPYAGPHPAPPATDWPQPTFQMGPGHPSFPSNPEGGGNWGGPWQPDPWQPDPSAWPAEPRTGFQSGDIWTPPRGSVQNGDRSLPRRPVPAPPPGGWSQDTNPPQRPGFGLQDSEPEPGTDPMPAAPPASAGDDYLPIFAAVESAWFGRDTNGASWGSSKADAGWSAAEAVVEPVRDGATAAGLPKRVPKANLVPGSADTAASPQGVIPLPSVSPDRVRNRLSSFQQGFRAARDDISEGRALPPAGPKQSEREEGA
ncbi:signal transduction histidine kinase [[Actinomadura] parvosata subsp. kistnae]|uniref:sensor histidine kinase n=1 Tax=[Actinomadura] parvosata TaxID=1955412 RepID=UPI000D2B6D0B|nr:nitrate- and nitrite sensing domain-containing protein [Nonomuraea sp. ATCC 55076]SPL97567.1 signal transduction histidine kinase [Actinomadura parvosata subsp. kistnae]